jgi:protein-disulfide isomerase
LLQYLAMTRARRVQILVSVAVVAVIAVAIAIAVGAGGDEASKPPATATAPDGSHPANDLFAGIPASGLAIGRPDAPAALEEFIDPQCPFCAQFSRDVTATLIEDYVRPGRLRMVMRPEAFIGEDSLTAARAVVAAGQQNKAWPFLHILFANQGPENSGYIDEAFLRRIGEQVEGLDVDAMLAAAKTDAVIPALRQADRRATQFGLDSTPAFLLTVGDGPPKPLPSDLDATGFTADLDKRLGQ